MTYREHLADAALATADLLHHPPHLDADLLPAALTCRAAFVGFLRDVYADTTGVVDARATDTVTDLQRHPVRALAQRLQTHPAHQPIALTYALVQAVDQPELRGWGDLAKASTLAAAEWHASLPASRPEGAERWSHIGDLAALSEALTHLDGDLAARLKAAGEASLAAEYHRASRGGLALAAREVRFAAGLGPQPAVVDLPVVSSRVLVVRSDREVPQATARLGHLLRQATEVSPAHVQLAARVLGGLSLRASRTLAHTGDPEARPLVESLATHAEDLAMVASAPRRFVSLALSEPGPLLQAREIHTHALAAGAGRRLFTTRVAHEVAAALPGASTSLVEVSEAQVRTRRWLTPVEGRDAAEPQWGRFDSRRQRPELLRALGSTRESAGRVEELAPRVQPTRVSWPEPRVVLARPLAARRAGDLRRPIHPSQVPARRR